MPVNESVVDSLTIENLKNIAGASAAAQAVIYQDQAAHRNRVNVLAESLLAKACHKIQDLDISDAVAQNTVNRGGADAGLPSLMSYIAMAAQQNKTVAITPPETGVSRAFADLAALSGLIDAIASKKA